jgi:hypothetical protein
MGRALECVSIPVEVLIKKIKILMAFQHRPHTLNHGDQRTHLTSLPAVSGKFDLSVP